MATHSSILAWRIPWTEECGRPQPVGLRVRYNRSYLAHKQVSVRNEWMVDYLFSTFVVFHSWQNRVSNTEERQCFFFFSFSNLLIYFDFWQSTVKTWHYFQRNEFMLPKIKSIISSYTLSACQWYKQCIME